MFARDEPITHSYILLDRISPDGERRIWRQNIADWSSFHAKEKVQGIGQLRKRFYDRQLQFYETALCRRELDLLAEALPAGERWRLYPLLKEEALYVDIETAERYGDITVLGVWDGERQYSLVKGKGLEKSVVTRLFAQHRLIVTFNGSSFDLPIIERYFRGAIPEGTIHIDLRHLLARLGLTGGLKAIERSLGLSRPEEIQGFDGAEALLLWHNYQLTGDEELLARLLSYNEADCKNLEPLAAWAVEELWRTLRDASP